METYLLRFLYVLGFSTCLFLVSQFFTQDYVDYVIITKGTLPNKTLTAFHDGKENILKDESNFPGIYVHEGYHVSDDTIRFVFLKHRDNQRKLEARIRGTQEWLPVKEYCYNATCDDYLFCDISTRIAVVKVDPIYSNIKKLEVGAKNNKEYFTMKINDVRIKKENSYPHQIGVCLQPIFYYSDWPLIIEFFESWIAQGATKFYFYVHSYTKQTKAVLDFYKEKLGDQLELINWSDVPVYNRIRGRYQDDPNSRIFRHGAIAFMHDCMFRARSNVKYIANFDLDDIPFARNGNLSETLDSLWKLVPNGAQVILKWRLSKRLTLDWDAIQRPKDVDVSFDDVQLFVPKTVSFGYKFSTKIIHRPERVAVFDMHNIYRNERIPNKGGKRYTTINGRENPNIYCLHLRRFERLVKGDTWRFTSTFDYSVFRNLSKIIRYNYSTRIKDTDFANLLLAPWAVEAREIIRNMEQCRREAFGMFLDDKNKMCQQSSAGCRGMLMGSTDFAFSPMSWIDIAHAAYFNQYVNKKEKPWNVSLPK